jgi:hypothetical protein
MYCGNKSPKNVDFFCHLQKADQNKQSPYRRKFAQSGTDVMILKIFSPKKSAENWRF